MKNHNYVQSMLTFIEIARRSYEPNRKIFGKYRNNILDFDAEQKYTELVEKEYMYFLCIAEHYINIK